MKKHIYLLLLGLCLMITGYSCSSDDDKPEPELIVSTESISFTKEGGDKDIHIKTNQKWSISSSESWCTVNPASGEGTGTIKITLSATANTTNDPRTSVLTVFAGGITKEVNITQQLTDLLVVKKAEYEVKAAGENITVELQTTGTHEITIDGDWITKSGTKAVTDLSEVFVIAPNKNIFSRKGTITYKIGDLSETVTISQAATSLNIVADKTGMANDASALAIKMGLGWNLGNTLEATDGITAGETSWGNPKASQTLIDAVKAAGFNTIRIPCAWNAYIEDESTYKIKDSWLVRVAEVVDYCVNNDMYAIINIHWDGGWLEENPTYDKQVEVNKKQKALWEQIAVYFRDYDEHLLFAGTNEVHADYNTPSTENIEVQQSYNQTFVNAVRSTGGKNTWRNLIVQSYNTNIDYAVDYMKMPSDPTANRIMAEVHFYDPYEFCLQEANTVFLWGKDFTGAGTASWGQEDWVDKQFGRMKANFADRGIPVVLGEYSPTLRMSLNATDYANHVKSRNYYLNYVTKAAVQNGMIPVYWDNGPTGDMASGLFNRLTGEQVHTDAIKSIIDGGKK
ncbi:MAG: cellulase family glycosylhydrolase [Prevotella sp.]|jgi:endoglucanase|nr:cellulase family glycosylhydrolase [Prevotella sp.]